MEVLRFPNVVGLDVERAKVSIRTKLCGKYAFFTLRQWTRNRKRETLAPQRDNEIILYIDDKFQCVAKTPEWRRGQPVEEEDIGYISYEEEM